MNHCTADASPDLRALLAVVPFGVDDAPPTRTAAGVRGSVHGIGVDDDVIVWGGGIYEWFDPLTLVHAIDRLRRRRPTVRLVFAGARHPNPTVGETSMGARTRALADDLGLTGTHVFFSDWAEHGARQNLLLDADIGVSTHVRGIETDYSFRTRVLDYLWASLPVVTTAGDALADEVVAGGAGIAIPPSDVEALEAALAQILDDDVLAHSLRSGAASLAPAYHWSRVLAPLLEFCRAPARAPDLLDAGMAQAIRRGAELSHSGVRSSAARAAALARGGDWAELRRRLVDRARRRG